MKDKIKIVKEEIETTIEKKQKPKTIVHTNSTYVGPGEKPKRLSTYKHNYRKIFNRGKQ